MKKRLFIGSSGEELPLAQQVKKLMEDDYEVSIWDEKVWDHSVFKLNQNFLTSLLEATLGFDFGIIIGSKDDEVKFRDTTVLQPRDNILFELGLFIGRLGTSHCAFLIDKEIIVLSDVQGITLARYAAGDTASLNAAMNEIRGLFAHSTDDEVNFFPSSTLAVIYFENFVLSLCRPLIQSGCKLDDGTIVYDWCLKIIIPKQIAGDVNLQLEIIKNSIPSTTTSISCAGRPRTVVTEVQHQVDKIVFIDFPTVLAGINHAIMNLLPKDFQQQNESYDLILNRELQRFIYTLNKLLKQHALIGRVSIEQRD